MNPLSSLGLERIRMEEDDRYVDVYYAARVEAVIAKMTAEADFARWRDCVDKIIFAIQTMALDEKSAIIINPS